MKIATGLLASVAVLAMAQTVQAAAPKVSGKYALLAFTQCQAQFKSVLKGVLNVKTLTFPSGGHPHDLDPVTRDGNHSHPFTTGNDIEKVDPMGNAGRGEINMSVGTLTFPATAASSGNASLELSGVSGSLLRITNLAGATNGLVVDTHTETASDSFAVTNTTFRFGAMTWSMRPGNIVNGVARTLYMVRRENERCENAVTLTKQ
jgi:hypothetical protein